MEARDYVNVLSIPHQGCSPSCALVTAEEKAPAFHTANPAVCSLVSQGNIVALYRLPAVGTLDLVTGAVAGKVIFPGMARAMESKGLL